MSTAPAPTAPAAVPQQVATQASISPEPMELIVYSHSPLFYWWPVWAVGCLMALLTLFGGVSVEFADAQVVIHPSKNLGVIYTVIFFLVIIMTNATVRGLASLTVVITILAVTFLFATLGWWEHIFRLVGSLAIYMNLGFYVFFSTAVFVAWLLAVFAFDHMQYWRFRPGQVVHGQVLGAGEQTYDTLGMSVSKMRDDLFRHWILGLGSGDMIVATTGARRQEMVIKNVLFVTWKVDRIQKLIAMRPDTTPDAGLVVPASPADGGTVG